MYNKPVRHNRTSIQLQCEKGVEETEGEDSSVEIKQAENHLPPLSSTPSHRAVFSFRYDQTRDLSTMQMSCAPVTSSHTHLRTGGP